MLLSAGGLVGHVGVIGITELLTRRWAYAVIVLGSASVVLCMFTRVSTIAANRSGSFPYAVSLRSEASDSLPPIFRSCSPQRYVPPGQGFCWNIMARCPCGHWPSGLRRAGRGSGFHLASGRLVACVYVVGIVAIWFGPETKDRPLQD